MSCLLNYSSKSWISVSFSLSSPLCAQELLQMSSGWPISGSLTRCQGWGQTAWGNSLSFCCKSAWNLAFTSSRHRLPMFSFFTVTFLLGFGFELQFEPAAYQTVVNVALCTGHHSCVKNVFQVSLVHEHVVK